MNLMRKGQNAKKVEEGGKAEMGITNRSLK
jgi:hypothetical protein